MNEKIEELYNECTGRVYARTDGYGNDHYRRVTDYEEFARLIIKQCLGIYESLDNGNCVMGTYDYPEAVVKYFGVDQ